MLGVLLGASVGGKFLSSFATGGVGGGLVGISICTTFTTLSRGSSLLRPFLSSVGSLGELVSCAGGLVSFLALLLLGSNVFLSG